MTVIIRTTIMNRTNEIIAVKVTILTKMILFTIMSSPILFRTAGRIENLKMKYMHVETPYILE
jgi:hypothetical protein